MGCARRTPDREDLRVLRRPVVPALVLPRDPETVLFLVDPLQALHLQTMASQRELAEMPPSMTSAAVIDGEWM